MCDDGVHRTIESHRCVIGDVGALGYVAVAYGGDDPNKGKSSGVQSRSAPKHELVVAEDVPFKAQSWREIDSCLGHVGGGKTADSGVGDGSQ